MIIWKNIFQKHRVWVEFFVVGSIIFFFRGSIYNWYKIPSGSMQPTIKIHDRVGVDMLAYGFTTMGASQLWFSWKKPQRGDIVIFKSPDDGKLFVKRVVGIEGDRINFDRGRLYLNGVAVEEIPVESDYEDILDDVEFGDKVLLYRERLPGENMYHFIQRQNPEKFDYLALTDAREFRTWTVPEDSLFFLGDNRSFSADSRYWQSTPFLKTHQVLGKVHRILYSFRRSTHWYDWPKIREGRFWLPLEKLANEKRWSHIMLRTEDSENKQISVLDNLSPESEPTRNSPRRLTE